MVVFLFKTQKPGCVEKKSHPVTLFPLSQLHATLVYAMSMLIRTVV